MFNALNRFISRLDGEVEPGRQSKERSYGFQVLRNSTMSLAIEPLFDFIIGINGRVIDNPEPRLFMQEVQNCAGGIVTLGVWSAKGQRPREMHILVPTDSSLGLTLQWTPLSFAVNVWHVLDVPPNSPADLAGLLPYGDFIVGSPEGVLHGESALGELVEDHIGRPMRFWVYNNEFDVSREVTVQPSRDWGGEGALGCVLGYGALHRLPPPLSEPVDEPGETMFDGDEKAAEAVREAQIGEQSPDNGGSTFVPAAIGESAGFLVPADLMGTTPMSTPAATRGKKKGKHGASHLMDDYLKEEEKRSRDLDNAPSRKSTPAPPPPKAREGVSPPTKAQPEMPASTSPEEEKSVKDDAE